MDVFNSYTGKSVELDPERTPNLDTLASRLAQEFGVDPPHQLLLVSPSASRLREDMISQKQQVYLFDLQLIAQPDMARSKLLSMEASAVAQLREANTTAPDSVAAFAELENSKMMLSQIVVDRSDWAMRQNEFAKEIAERIQSLTPEMATIDTATHLALTHMSNHLKTLRRTLIKRVKEKEELDRDIARCSTWSESWARCKRVPGLAQNLSKLSRPEIADMFDKALQMQYKVKKQLALVEKAANSLHSRGTELLATSTQNSLPTSIPGVERLRREMESLTNKVVFDTNNVKALYDKKLAQTVLSGHEQSLIPDIGAVRQDLLAALNRALDYKTAAQSRLCQVMASISSIQLESAKLKPDQAKLSTLLQEADGYKAKVAEIIELPFLYGAYIIELNRRQTWQFEHRNMVDLMVERLASLRDVELERMENWKQYYLSSGIMSKISAHLVHDLPEIEVNLMKVAVPSSISIEEYLDQLDQVGFSEVADELRGELEAMSQQLAKSLEENGLSMSSSNYENKIRKLESILLQLRFDQQRAVSGSNSSAKKDAAAAAEANATAQINEKERAIAERERALLDRERAYAERIQALEKRHQAIADREKTLAIRENALASRQQTPAEDLALANRQNVSLQAKATELSALLISASKGVRRTLESMGLQARTSVVEGVPHFDIVRVKGLRKASVASGAKTELAETTPQSSQSPSPREDDNKPPAAPDAEDGAQIAWVESPNFEAEYNRFVAEIFVDYGVLEARVSKRFGDMEKLARQLQTEVHTYKTRVKKAQHENRNRLALQSFKVDDLVLFLPTRDSLQQPKPWAAFNVGAPHYFLDPSIAAEMQSKEYLIGRVKDITQYTVETAEPDPVNNPFGLALGITWSKIVAEWPNQGKGVATG